MPKVLTRTTTILTLSVLLLISVFRICNAQPRYGGTLTIVTSTEPTSFCPSFSFSFYGLGQIYNSLIRHDFQGNPLPELAESWTISPDGMNYTFHLVRNATFHDGVPLTSADVKFTIEEILKPYGGVHATVYAAVDHIETPDNYTVTLLLKYPYSPLMAYLGDTCGVVAPKHLYEGTDILANPYNFEPIGSGPFVFSEWIRGSHVIMVKNENYWEAGKPYLDKIIYKFVADTATRAMVMEMQEADACLGWGGLGLSDAARLIANPPPGLTISIEPGYYGEVSAYMLNLRNEPLDNVKVRQAIAHSIDREFINVVGFEGLGTVIWSPMIRPILEKFYNPDEPKLEYNTTKANQLLDEAGYPRGGDGKRFSLEIVYDLARPKMRIQAEILIAQLEVVGIELVPVVRDYVTTRQMMADWDFDIFTHSWGVGPDPNVMVGRWLHSDQIRHVPDVNCMGYNNSRVDELLDLDARETNETKRSEYWKDIMDIVLLDVPMVFVMDLGYPVAYWEDFRGIPPGPTFLEGFESVWWVGGASTGELELEDKVTSLESHVDELSSRVEMMTNIAYVAIGVAIVGTIVAVASLVLAKRRP